MDKIEARKRKIYNLTSPLPSKDTILSLFLLAIVISYVYSIYYAYNADISMVECGTIHKQFERKVNTGSKSDIRTEIDKIMVIKYSDRYVEKNVVDDLYYRKKVGDRVCFDEPTDELSYYSLSMLYIIAITLITVVGGIVGFGDDICNFFANLWSKFPDR